MGKKSSMQKEVEKTEQATASGVPVGEQMPLIDVAPEHSKEIVRVARAYNAKVKARLLIQKGRDGEEELQEILLELVKAENLTRDKDGKIKFKVDGVGIELTPTKEKVKVTIDE
jgi:hypothetical protein